ncbi:MAG: response regulator [Alphaproteobacteria bacterium]|nr:response regulator [Alphaproteobacteria bacterium]
MFLTVSLLTDFCNPAASEINLGLRLATYNQPAALGSANTMPYRFDHPLCANLLIVEDDPIAAQHLGREIIKLGYGLVTICSNRQAAEQEILSQSFDLVLLDLHLGGKMGELEGIALAEWITEQKPHGCDPAIVVVSAYLSHPDLSSLSKIRIRGYLAKPFHPLNLEQLLRKMLRPDDRKAVSVKMPLHNLAPAAVKENLPVEDHG